MLLMLLIKVVKWYNSSILKPKIKG
jgi:hypothetical protein